MICHCICKCKNNAGGNALLPELCIECALNATLGESRYHDMPAVPDAPAEQYVRITPDKVDKALQNWIAENGF